MIETRQIYYLKHSSLPTSNSNSLAARSLSKTLSLIYSTTYKSDNSSINYQISCNTNPHLGKLLMKYHPLLTSATSSLSPLNKKNTINSNPFDNSRSQSIVFHQQIKLNSHQQHHSNLPVFTIRSSLGSSNVMMLPIPIPQKQVLPAQIHIKSISNMLEPITQTSKIGRSTSIDRSIKNNNHHFTRSTQKDIIPTKRSLLKRTQ